MNSPQCCARRSNGNCNPVSTARLFRRVFSKQITLVVQTAPGLRVRGVSSELSQVILNLCLNARDAMPRGGTLTLRTEIAVVEREPAAVVGEGSAGSSSRTMESGP